MTTSAPVCGGCGGRAHDLLYEVDGVPAHSCVLHRDPEEARGVPTAAIRLGRCRRCGLVANVAFDPAVIDYSQEYEETQAYSGRFRAFLDDLVADVTARHDVDADTHVLEVGCGKGEFLAALCSRTGARGLGIDPAWRDERRPADAPRHVDYVRGTFGPGDDRRGDLVVCRHTLEHVPDVRDFLVALADAARPGGSVVVEVPDAARILEEGAFWDVYHEHCVYPTADVLADLAVRCGLRVDTVEQVYDHQYLVLHAHPDEVDPPASPSPPPVQVVTPFETTRRRWSDWASQQASQGRRVVLWGAGSKAVAFLAGVGAHGVAAAVDVNPHKHGTHLPGSGLPVLAPTALAGDPPDVVLAMNPTYVDEIRRDLSRLGVAVPVVALTPAPPTVTL